MKWFTFQGIVLHTADNIKHPEEHLQSLLKVFSMFKIRILYDEIIGLEDVPEYVRIMCITCGKIISGSFENQNIENFITIFFINMVFQHVHLSWFIKLN